MQKWEYLFLDLGVGETKDGLWVITMINGKSVGQTSNKDPYYSSGPMLGSYLNQLGDDGWELVIVDLPLFIFKRPK